MSESPALRTFGKARLLGPVASGQLKAHQRSQPKAQPKERGFWWKTEAASKNSGCLVGI
ncbi:MAG: hypothetical protein JJ964_09315 [Rhizobiales bacterium]|nr:hypothetical protein [Hyphomicrobiales bacterium]